jgi:SNF2 family DNA or RNA helicase
VIHVSSRHRVIGVPVMPELVGLFPDAKKVMWGGKDVLVLPHSFTETKLLRTLGLDVPAPVLTQYDWRGGEPFDVQRKTVAMLTTNQRAYVLNGMGTGKTKAALWAWDYLRSNKLANRLLVIAPLSTLNFTWRREILNTLPGVSVGVLHGSKDRRLKILKQEHDIYVINTDGIKVLFDELMLRDDIDTLVIDELANFRNGQSDRSKILRKLAKRMTFAWGMTGSPTPNEPTDAWGQAMILTPANVDKSFVRFREKVMIKVTNFKWTPKRDAAETVVRVLQPAVRFTLDDVIELPEVIHRTQDIDLGPKQAKVYKALMDHARALVDAQEITAANAGAVLGKLLQVSLGYVYGPDRAVVELDNQLRIDALIDAIESTDRKVIVWVPYKHALHGVYKALLKSGIDTRMVYGGTPRKQREENFSLFQGTDNVRVLACHPVCASHGLTLTAADTCIWFSPTTSLETYEQANARIRRIGQKHKQLILHFQSTPAERKIYTLLARKDRIQKNILDLFAETT